MAGTPIKTGKVWWHKLFVQSRGVPQPFKFPLPGRKWAMGMVADVK